METIRLPKLATTMEEGTVVRWLKRQGDPLFSHQERSNIFTLP